LHLFHIEATDKMLCCQPTLPSRSSCFYSLETWLHGTPY